MGRLLTPETPLFIIAIIASTLVVGLITIVLWATFLTGLPGVEAYFSLDNYADVFLNPLTYTAGLNSLLLGLGTVAVNLFFAVPMAWLIHRSNVRFKPFFLNLMYLSIVIPGFLQAIAWILLLSPKIGMLNQLLRILVPVGDGPLSVYNITSMAFLQGLVLTPVMFFMIAPAFLAADPALEEAAEMAGGRGLKVLRHITIPLVMPAVVAAVLYNFMTAIAMYEIPALLGSPSRINVLSTLMFTAVHTDVGLPRYGLAGVYGVVLLVPMLLALVPYQHLLRRSYRYAVVTGKGYRPKVVDLGPWKWAGAAFLGLYFLLEFFLPLLVLIWASVNKYIRLPSPEAFASIGLDSYRTAFSVLSGRAFFNTAILTITVAATVLFLSVVISWIVLRTSFRGRYVLDTVAMLPHAVPSLAFAFAIAFVALSVNKAIPLYGSLMVIILAHSVAYISFGTRTINGALVQIHQELEEAAMVSGASRIVGLRTVVLPLLGPALFYAGLWVALLSFREVTMALFLRTPQNAVLSTSVWTFWANADVSSAAALGFIMFLGMVVVVVILLRTASQVFYGLRNL